MNHLLEISLVAILGLSACQEKEKSARENERSSWAQEGEIDGEKVKLQQLAEGEPNKETTLSWSKIVRERLERVVIPKIEFEETPLDEAIEYLYQKSIELDPEPDLSKKGIGFVMHQEKETTTISQRSVENADADIGLLLDDDSKVRHISLHRENITVGQAFFEVSQQAGMDMYLGGKVVFVPKGQKPSEADYLTPYLPE